MKSMLVRFSQHRVIVVANLVALSAALALSIGAMFRYQSGLLLLALGVIWSVGAGVLGYRLRTWLCPLAMLALIMAWEVIYGRTSWASLYVFPIPDRPTYWHRDTNLTLVDVTHPGGVERTRHP